MAPGFQHRGLNSFDRTEIAQVRGGRPHARRRV
jgi:hypothetical protein